MAALGLLEMSKKGFRQREAYPFGAFANTASLSTREYRYQECSHAYENIKIWIQLQLGASADETSIPYLEKHKYVTSVPTIMYGKHTTIYQRNPVEYRVLSDGTTWVNFGQLMALDQFKRVRPEAVLIACLLESSPRLGLMSVEDGKVIPKIPLITTETRGGPTTKIETSLIMPTSAFSNMPPDLWLPEPGLGDGEISPFITSLVGQSLWIVIAPQRKHPVSQEDEDTIVKYLIEHGIPDAPGRLYNGKIYAETNDDSIQEIRNRVLLCETMSRTAFNIAILHIVHAHPDLFDWRFDRNGEYSGGNIFWLKDT